MKNNYDLSEQLKDIGREEIHVPAGLSSVTAELVLTERPEMSILPYVIIVVFAANILVSLFFGGILFLMRPITLIEWIIIGSVYTTVNVLLYGLTFLNYDKVQNVLKAYSNGGVKNAKT